MTDLIRLPEVALDTARRILTADVVQVINLLCEAGLNAEEISAWINCPNEKLDAHPPIGLLIQSRGDLVHELIRNTHAELGQELQ